MRIAWRWFLITWLVVALPLQGAVAATLRHCGSAPTAVQAQGQAQAQSEAGPRAPSHHPEGAHEAHHAHHGMQAVDGHDSAVQVEAAGTCSVCAACCPAMAVVMPSLETPAPLSRVMRYSVPAAAAPPEGLPTGLERPPRLTLA